MQKKFNINTELARQLADKNMIKHLDPNNAIISPNNTTPSTGSSDRTPDSGNTSNYSLYDSPGSATSDTTIPFNDNTYDAISPVKILSHRDEIPIRMINIKVSPGIIEKRKIFENSRAKDDLSFVKPPLTRKRSKSVTDDLIPRVLKKTVSHEHLTMPILGKTKSIQNPILLKDETQIEDVVNFIFHKRLKLDNIDTKEWCVILRNNLILNYKTLCRQSPETIDRLKLPLALETELKSLIMSKNGEFYQIKTMSDITVQIKIKIKKSFNFLKENQKARNIFYDEFYKLLFNINKPFEKLFKGTGMVARSEALFENLNLIIKFIEGDDIREDINKIATKYIIYGIDNKCLSTYAYALSETFIKSMDIDYVDERIKEAWFVVAKLFGEQIIKQYDIIRHGKNYYIYYRKHKKWHKCFCRITHDKLYLSTYPRNEIYFDFNLSDITNIDVLDPSDHRITKQTIFCISIEYDNEINETHFICVDTKEIMTSIYNDLKIRVEAYDHIK